MAKHDELLDHDYDGIQEYDNDLPRWWVYLFWVTILFAVVRVVYYHFGPGLLQEERLAAQMADLEEVRTKVEATKASTGFGEKEMFELAARPAVLQQGAALFTAKCLACHGPQGQGLVGPNLTDDYWIHGGKIMDIRKVVTEGILEKGMLAWKGQISDDEINAVVAYVWSIRGTNPPNPKSPEGEQVEY